MNKTDDNTFSLMLGVAPWVPIFKNLRDDRVHMDVARALPGMAAWLDPAVSEPIWRVEPFGGLVNRYRRFMIEDEPLFRNFFVLGDSRFHTNPIFGWGMGMALQQACMLVDAFSGHDDEASRMRSFEQAADAYALDHYEASAGEDRARAAYWRGDLGARQEPGTYEYFVTQVQPAAFKDQVIFQAVTRRLHLLDGSNAILTNDEVNARAAKIPRTDHKKMTRAEIHDLVEASCERAGIASRPQMAG
jgi:hypothetical protein